MNLYFSSSLHVGGQRYDAAQCTCPVVTLTDTGDTYLYRRMSLHNPIEQNTPLITEPYTLDATLPCAKVALLHTLQGDNCSAQSFLPVDHALDVGETYTLCPTGGRSSNTSAFPFLDLTIDGKPYLFAIGWSGQWKCVLHRNEEAISIQVGLAHAHFYMEPGETLHLPSVLVMEGTPHEDASALRRRFRQLLMTEFSPLPKGMTHLPIAIQPFDRYFYGRKPEWVTIAGQLSTLSHAVDCEHFDTLWIDAAWFRDGFPTGVGNYSFADGFAGGLLPIANAVHDAGMRFMVWFEPERVYAGSEVYKYHPEFLLNREADANTYLFDLGNEEAWQWLRDTLVNFIRDNGIDNFRQDFNMDPLEYWRTHDTPDREGITEIRYINGLYRLWDALHEAFPDLLIDDCSSGGRRIDLETMRRAVPLWRSDVTCHPITDERHCDVWNQNETLTLGEYLPYHACATWEPRAFEVRAAATAGLACTFDILNPDFDVNMARTVLQEVEHLTTYWKGDFYPLTPPTLAEDGFSAFQLALPDSGYAAIFRRADCVTDTFFLKLQAVDPTATYIVSITDETYHTTETTVAGTALESGYAVQLSLSHSSAVVEYRRN